MKERITRKEQVLNYLNEFGCITMKAANETLGMKDNAFYSAIHQLRDIGYPIILEKKTGKPLYTTYILADEKMLKELQSKTIYEKKDHERLYRTWQGFRSRCHLQNGKDWENYGGRGIKVCKEWDESFQAFAEWAFENGYNEDAHYGECTLDRIDTNGNYEPSNCRWISLAEQSNNRRNNILINFRGETKTASQWADDLGISKGLVYQRLRKGWDIEEALLKPSRKRGAV